jgi:hypothetical protein
MIRFILYFLLCGAVFYLIAVLAKSVKSSSRIDMLSKPNSWFQAKKNLKEIWVQVYETASIEEARMLQARLEEEEVECIVYEQGKKDIYGNRLIGVGLAVPKAVTPRAQNIVSRMLA